MEGLNLLKKNISKKIENADDVKKLNEIFQEYLGKKGEIMQAVKSIGKLPKEKRAKAGKEINEVKDFLQTKIDEKIQETKERIIKEAGEKEWIDITIPGKRIKTGYIHPLTQSIRSAVEIFQSMGFSVAEGLEIETEWYNFDALNVPKDHPARDVQDTFWLKQEKDNKQGKKLMRCHTSAVQIHYMEKNNPPFRIVAPGKVFRHEATDASHDVQFHQLEGMMVGKGVSLANLKAVINEFLDNFFNKKVEIRLRPSYFPFTEPSVEIDIKCLNCKGKGCSVCKKTGWLETIGAGMVHPNVLKAGGLNPKFWQGFAFGMGIDRLVMMKYKIDDIRLFYSGDIKFLEQF